MCTGIFPQPVALLDCAGNSFRGYAFGNRRELLEPVMRLVALCFV